MHNSNPMAKNKLKLDPKNARQRTDRNRETIAQSLSEFGAARSIVIDKDGVVRAGNGTFEEAEKAGLKVRVIKGKPDELIAVQRDDWDESQATAYAIADNKTAELAEWDFESLATNLKGLSERLQNATGFANFEIEPLLQATWEPPQIEDVDTQDAGETVSVKFTIDQFQIVNKLAEAKQIDPAAAAVVACAQMLADNN